MPPRTRHGRREPTPDPVSENEDSSGDEYVQSDDDNMENVEGDEMEVSDDGDDNESGNGEDDEASDDRSPLDSTIQFVLNLRNAQQYTILRHHNQFRRPNDCNDPRFHTRFQKSVYAQVYANKAFAEHKWISWKHIGETPEFENLQEMFRTVGIDRIVTMKQPFDEDLIRQFYATVWVSGDCDAMKWMSRTLRCSINRRESKELLHIRFNNGDDLHDEHTHNPFPIDHFSQFYEEGGRHTYGKVAGLRALPSVINRIVRATILPRCGNNDDIRGVAWHVIDAIMDGRRFDVINLMMKEIAISKGTLGQGIYYAPYIMRLIQSKLGQIGHNLKEHKEYKPRLQLSSPRAPRVRQPTFDQGASSSAAPPSPQGYDPSAFFHLQYAYFGMQPNDFFNPVLGAIHTLSESIQRLSTGHEALHEDVRGLCTDVGNLNTSVGRLHTRVGVLDSRVQTLESTQAFVYHRHRDASHPSTSARPPSPPQE
uniref:OSJNBa0084K01.23 protein n=1 Tax=Oryza sativa subsp. japonica TaxID=39947 RepID=Q7XM08_ORYSJ|nr:OSJNBa0084K01.23 [Oryza sativa Japonica Group]